MTAKNSNMNDNNSGDDLPIGYSLKMVQMYKSLENLEKKLSPILSQSRADNLNKLNPVDKAKVGLLCVYTTNILFWVSMKISENENDKSILEDFKREMGRIKAAQDSLAEIEASKNKPKTDPKVAKRMIDRSLGMNSKRKSDENNSENNKKHKPSSSSS